MDADELWWISNAAVRSPQQVVAGVHDLSNAALDTPWPKVRDGTADFAAALAVDDGTNAATQQYFDILADTRRAPWKALPHTGVSKLDERRLSANFIDKGRYGTRASTVLRVRRDGSFEIAERRFGRRRRPTGATCLTWPAR